MRDLDDSNDKEMKDLLARARRDWSPRAGDADRVRRGLGAALTPGAAARTTPAQGWGTHPWIGRVMLTAAFTAAGAAGGYWAGRRASRPGEQPRFAATAPQPATPAPPPTMGPDRARGPAQNATAVAGSGGRHLDTIRRHAAAPPAQTPAESLAVEVRGLRNVERALRDHNPGLATVYLDDLEREVPGGQMREERVALRAIASCAHGSQPFGVNLAQDFATAYPASAYRARVEQACGGTDSNVTGDSAGRR